MIRRRKPALDDNALTWAHRGVWTICIGMYLVVFVGGITSGGDELFTLGRAAAFTLAAGFLGKMGLGLLSRASLPLEQGPSADEVGPVGSLIDLVGSTNVAQHEDMAEAA
jgi:hypothetical protein